MANGAPQIPFNINPATNPTHPAHQDISRHLGAAIGHIMAGDHGTAKQHMHAIVDKWFAPHDEAAMQQEPMMPNKIPKPDKKRKAKKNAQRSA